MGRGPRGGWVRFFYSGVGYAVGCIDEVRCGWEWDPRFALEYVELVRAWLFQSVAWFTSPVGWAGY